MWYLTIGRDLLDFLLRYVGMNSINKVHFIRNTLRIRIAVFFFSDHV